MAEQSDSIVLEEDIDPNYEPTEKEVLEYATWLGMDLEAENDLFWIVREGLKAPLPEDWKPCKTKDTEEVYYFNFSTGETTWDHPCDSYYRNLYEKNKKKIIEPSPLQDSENEKTEGNGDTVQIFGELSSMKEEEMLDPPRLVDTNEKQPPTDLVSSVAPEPVAGLDYMCASEADGNDDDGLTRPNDPDGNEDHDGAVIELLSPAEPTTDRSSDAEMSELNALRSELEQKKKGLLDEQAELIKDLEIAHKQELEEVHKQLQMRLNELQEQEDAKLQQKASEWEKKLHDLEEEFDRQESALKRERCDKLKRMAERLCRLNDVQEILDHDGDHVKKTDENRTAASTEHSGVVCHMLGMSTNIEAIRVAGEMSATDDARTLKDQNEHVEATDKSQDSPSLIATESDHVDIEIAANMDGHTSHTLASDEESRTVLAKHTDVMTTEQFAQANIMERENANVGQHLDNQLGTMLNLCEKTGENQSLCLSIYDQIKMINEHLCGSDATSQVLTLVDCYCEFLEAIVSRRENILDQLMKQRGVMTRLEDFHQEVNDVITQLKIREEYDWELQWKAHQIDMAKQFQVRVIEDDALLKNVYDLVDFLKQLDDELIRCHDQEHLPSMQFIRDTIVERLNSGYQIDVSILKITDLAVVDPRNDVFVMVQVGTDTQHTKLIKRNMDPVWDVSQIFRFTLNKKKDVDMNIQVWTYSRPVSADSYGDNDAWPLLELIGEVSINFPSSYSGNFNVPTVASYPLEIPKRFENQNGQIMVQLKLSHPNVSSHDVLSPTEVGRGCLVCRSPAPCWPYCTCCARVFDQQVSSSTTMPKWFIVRQRIMLETTEKTTGQGMITKILAGKLDHDSSIDVWYVSIDKTYERDIVVQQIDLWFTLKHPHILRLFGACHVKDPMLCACEHAAYITISDYLAADTNLKCAWMVLYEAALGLQYLHSQSIVHGSISCENIVLGIEGKTKLCNFGFSYRQIGSSLLHANTCTLYKKSRCMAPERINGDDMMEPLFESDIYDFGMVIIEAITGKSSWSSSTTEDIFASFLSKSQSFAWSNDERSDAWKLVAQMCDLSFKKRPNIGTVVTGLKKLANPEKENVASFRIFASAFGKSNCVGVTSNLHERRTADESVEPIAGDVTICDEKRLHNLCVDMGELKPMCEYVISRFGEMDAMWQSVDERKRNQAALCYTVISDAICAFFIEYGRVRKITRLLYGSRLADICNRFHSQLDYLLYLCDLEVDHEWELKWEKDNQFRVEIAETMLAQANFVDFELQDTDAKIEVTSFLLHQPSSNTNEERLGKDELSLIKMIKTVLA